MGRPAGKRNADYDATREGLLRKLYGLVMTPRGATASFRELAAHVEVSPATLRHYFSSRESLLIEVLRHARQKGDIYLSAAATHPIADVRESLRWLLVTTLLGFERGGLAPHQTGLIAGLGDETLGPAYVELILEPTYLAVEARIARHIAAGDLAPCNVRHAAMELLSPVVLAVIHQRSLFGSRSRELDLAAFIEDHVERFLRAYRPG